jgi:hypothetical protein
VAAPNEVHVSRLPATCSADAIKAAMAAFGPVTKVGYTAGNTSAFVVYSNNDAAAAAIGKAKVTIDGAEAQVAARRAPTARRGAPRTNNAVAAKN